jgi:hypothetical protein
MGREEQRAVFASPLMRSIAEASFRTASAVSRPAASPPARRWHPPEPSAPADCPLPPAAYWRLLRSFAAPQPPAVSTPVGCRRHPLSGEPAAIEAAPPPIVLLCVIVIIVEVIVLIVKEKLSASQKARAVIPVAVSVLYAKTRLACPGAVSPALKVAVLFNP